MGFRIEEEVVPAQDPVTVVPIGLDLLSEQFPARQKGTDAGDDLARRVRLGEVMVRSELVERASDSAQNLKSV